MSFVYFILLLGGLIFFHEFGHFIVARWMGVHVVTFSIGFGPKLFGFKGKQPADPTLPPTEYIIAALPLGGYVKMLGDAADEDPEAAAQYGDVAFSAKPVWRRFLIVAAGPVFNLILPFIIFFFLNLSASQLSPSTVGVVLPGPAQAAGIPAGSRITSIDGEEVAYWYQVLEEISARPGKSVEIGWEFRGQPGSATLVPDTAMDPRLSRVGLEREVGRIGISHTYPEALVAVAKGSAADMASLSNWDRVLSVEPVGSEREFVNRFDIFQAILLENPNRPLDVTVLRAAPEPVAGLKLGLGDIVTLRIEPDPKDPRRGISSAEMLIHDVIAGSPAQKMGLTKGSRVTELCTNTGKGLPLTCRSYPLWNALFDQLGRTVQLEGQVVLRWLTPDNEAQETEIVLDEHSSPAELQPDRKIQVFGVEVISSTNAAPQIANDSTLGYAVSMSLKDGWYAIYTNAVAIAGLFTGKVSTKELGGPIMIGQLAAKTSERGAEYFFQLMIWFSVSLGLINLLPVPILDGGHILFLAIEAVRRKPVSLRTRQLATYVGFALIMVLMVYVFKNDIQRAFFG